MANENHNPSIAPESLRVFDPRGDVRMQQRAIAPRLATLDGKRLAILDNTKWNGNKLLRKLRDRLQAGHRLANVNYYTKESFSKFAAPEILYPIRRNNDFVLTAIAD